MHSRHSRTYQVGYHDLGLAAQDSGGSSRRGLSLLALLGRLRNTAYRSGSGGRSSSARTASAAAAARSLRGLEDVVEALLHLVCRHGDEWLRDDNTWAERAVV